MATIDFGHSLNFGAVGMKGTVMCGIWVCSFHREGVFVNEGLFMVLDEQLFFVRKNHA